MPGEFLQLRVWFDEHARAEAPRSGMDEYRQCRDAPDWPGLEAVLAAAALLAARDDQWQRGFAPGLAKFLRERQWLKKPAPPRSHRSGGNAAPGLDLTIIANLSTAERVLAKRQGGTQ